MRSGSMPAPTSPDVQLRIGAEDPEFLARANVGGGPAPRHAVRFYTDDAALLDLVAAFLVRGLAADGAAIAIVTPAHRGPLLERLASAGVDVAKREEDRVLHIVDADEAVAGLVG